MRRKVLYNLHIKFRVQYVYFIQVHTSTYPSEIPKTFPPHGLIVVMNYGFRLAKIYSNIGTSAIEIKSHSI